MVKYSLFLNKLTPDPDDYAARVIDVKTYTLQDIIKIMIRKGKTLTEEEAYGAYMALEKAIMEVVEEGGNVNLSIVNTNFSIRGVFHSEDEPFTEGKHSFHINTNPGEVLTEAAKKVKLKRVKAREYSPDPLKVEDIGSGTTNQLLTPANMACLKGSNLSFNPEDAEEGFYLINDKNQETKITSIARNKPSEVVFLVPHGLKPGIYALEVRNRGYSELISARLKHSLTVS